MKRISTFPLKISHNGTNSLGMTSRSIGGGPEPYSEVDASSLMGGSVGSVGLNMLKNQKELISRQRANLESQPKAASMFDQATIMRAHQTARSGPRGDLKGV